MSKEPKLATTRLEWTLLVLAAVLAVILCFVPLLNVLGYEFATVFCVFATFLCGAIAVQTASSPHLTLSDMSLSELYVAVFVRTVRPLWIPLGIISLNALRVRNCDYWVGLSLYLLLPVVSCGIIAGYALWARMVFPNHLVRWFAYYGLIIVSVAASLFHLATEPAVYAFHHTIGYFAGSIYDEALAIPQGLLLFRLWGIALVALILAGIQFGISRVRGTKLKPPLAVAVLALVTISLVFAQRFDLRIEGGRGDIIDALGGRVESEHFVIYYSLKDSQVADNIDEVILDHEYRWDQLAEFFGVEPPYPVFSFIYPSQATKARYMGAGRTLIAKPWLGEMHITYERVGEGHLAHELAHLFTEPFGQGPLSLAGGLLNPNMGLIEGAATAGAWDGSQLTYHGWSAALYELDLAPNLEDVLAASGFWASYSRTVYTLMGSFSRWLVDEYGAEKFRSVYGTGDFEAVYGVDMGALVARWRAFLDTLTIDRAHIEVAEYRYDRPSIFGKPCARALAERVDQARGFSSARQYHRAVECMASVVADDPENVRYLLFLARLERQAGMTDEAIQHAESVAETEQAGQVLRAKATELIGDIAWSRGDFDEAAARYESVLERPIPEADLRMTTIKLEAVRSAGLRDIVFTYLLAAPPVPRDAMTLQLAEEEVRNDSLLLGYLLGVRLFNARDYLGAVQYMTPVVEYFAITPPTERGYLAILRRASQIRSESLYFLGRLEEAQDGFETLAASGDPAVDAFSATALNWARRCEWRD